MALGLAHAAPARADDVWSLWQSSTGGAERVDVAQERFDAGSHANVSSTQRVGQTFVPRTSRLARIDVQLNNRGDRSPGWVRLYRWRGSHARTTAESPLWSDDVELSGPRGFRLHSFHPNVAVSPGEPLLLELGAAARRVPYQVRHSYKSDRDAGPYAAGSMWSGGKQPRRHWDLWFRSYAPAGDVAPHELADASFPASTERRRFQTPLRARPVERDDYRARLLQRVDFLRPGILGSCVPAPWEMLGEAIAYRVTCAAGRCDPAHLDAAYDMLDNIAARRDCRPGHASQPPRCVQSCRASEAPRANADWLLAASLTYRWTREAPRLGERRAERIRRFIAASARDAMWSTEPQARLRPAPRPVVEAGVAAHDVVRRSAGAALGSPGDPLVELGVALDADGVVPALRLQQVEQHRDGEGGVCAKPAARDRGPGLGRVARQHGAQNVFPAVGAVHVAGPERAAFQIAELVEHEQRVQALRLEMAVPGRALLVAVDRALGAVHVERDDLRRAAIVNGVDPAAGEIGQRGEVLGPRQHRGLEPTHCARRRRAALHRPATDELAHHRITAQPVGVVDVLVAGEAREDRLAQEPGEVVPAVLADARVGDHALLRNVGQAEGVVQLPVQEQSAVGADRGAPERELHRAVKLEPQSPRFLFR